jgi:Conserved hypothetical protein 698
VGHRDRLVIRNTVGVPAAFRPGVATYEFWLKIGTTRPKRPPPERPTRRRRRTKPALTSLGNLSKWAFLLCFAGVGLNFDLRELARSGVRPLVFAALGLVVVAACSLGLVLLTSGWLVN